ncbi:MAG: GTP cyclohydrolase I FolE [Bdellovibrionaceae bacterium]|nr:GTP cyclohydrolase I FolE [Pseudobdellovibrionaceae bacterium]
MQEQIKHILNQIGENPERQGLLSTPKRVEKSYEFLTSGYHQTVEEVIGEGVFDAESNDMVVVRDIEFYSLCEHHMIPFFGKAHVAYIPDQKILGLSKIPRVVDVFARRLQVQERLTNQVAEGLMNTLAPQGVGVVIEAYHLCMMMRGVQKQNSKTITSAMKGDFYDDPATRKEFFDILKSGPIIS